MYKRQGDHADELETSVMMHYHPELVNLDEAGNGDYKKFTSQMLNEKVAWIRLRHIYPFFVGWNLTPFYNEIALPHTNTLFSCSFFSYSMFFNK